LVLPGFVSKTFEIPNEGRTNDYFPDFLKNLLNHWFAIYKNSLQPMVDSNAPFEGGNKKRNLNGMWTIYKLSQ
jgi:hypothetical protein